MMSVKKRISIKLILFTLFLCVVQIAIAQESVSPSNALQHYLHNGDTTYHWSIKDTFSIRGVKAYNLLLVSQKWRKYTWKHQLTIFKPKENDYNDALVFITSGSNDKADQTPHFRHNHKHLMDYMAEITKKNKAIVAIIHQIPNEPLFKDLKEDRLISYTLHQYQEDTTDYTWPLLFPMVKGTVKAMDAVQEFSKNKWHHTIDSFVLSGASKRGWTTWLAGANDPRVEAIAPMAIDVVNMPVNLKHQMDAYGGFSIAIHDYVRLGIVQGLSTPRGKALVEMIDPFSYRNKLDMPKMICVGSNDQYWVIDNLKNYLPEMPGTNLIYYAPNVKHLIEYEKATYNNLSAFFGSTLDGGEYPKCLWTAKTGRGKIELSIQTSEDRLLGATIWRANSKDKDFRNDTFYSRDLKVSHQSSIKVNESLPDSGYSVFYVALNYQNPKGGSYIVCTRAFMTDTQQIFKSDLK